MPTAAKATRTRRLASRAYVCVGMRVSYREKERERERNGTAKTGTAGHQWSTLMNITVPYRIVDGYVHAPASLSVLVTPLASPSKQGAYGASQ